MYIFVLCQKNNDILYCYVDKYDSQCPVKIPFPELKTPDRIVSVLYTFMSVKKPFRFFHCVTYHKYCIYNACIWHNRMVHKRSDNISFYKTYECPGPTASGTIISCGIIKNTCFYILNIRPEHII